MVQMRGYRLPMRFMPRPLNQSSREDQHGPRSLPKGAQAKHFAARHDGGSLFAGQHTLHKAYLAESRSESHSCCSSWNERCSDSAPRPRPTRRCSSCRPNSHKACQASTAFAASLQTPDPAATWPRNSKFTQPPIIRPSSSTMRRMTRCRWSPGSDASLRPALKPNSPSS